MLHVQCDSLRWRHVHPQILDGSVNAPDVVDAPLKGRHDKRALHISEEQGTDLIRDGDRVRER